MDKISRIKELVKISLDTSFGGDISISEMNVLPTQKYDEETNKWVPDSFSVFLTIKKNQSVKNESLESINPYKITNMLESLLGFECCVDFV